MVGAVVVLCALAGCGAHGDAPKEQDEPRTVTGNLKQVAAAAHCDDLDVQTDAADIQQANCTGPTGGYVLVTFRTDRGQHEWLDAAADYGGDYLVGRKWIAVGTEPVLHKLRGRIGGTVVESSSHHSGNPSGGGIEEEHHSGHHAN